MHFVSLWPGCPLRLPVKQPGSSLTVGTSPSASLPTLATQVATRKVVEKMKLFFFSFFEYSFCQGAQKTVAT